MIGKWMKSSIPGSNGKPSRELVVSLVGQPLEDAKERFKKTVGTEATALVGEMTKTLQLLVLQRQDDQRPVEVSQHEMKRYLFSSYYPNSGFVNGDRDPNEPCKIVSDSLAEFLKHSVLDDNRPPGMIQILCSRLMALNRLETHFIEPTKNEAVNILFIYEYVFYVCVAADDEGTERYGFPKDTPIKTVQTICNQTFRYLIWMRTNKWPERDVYNFTV